MSRTSSARFTIFFVGLITLLALPAQSAGLDQCLLFPGGVQDTHLSGSESLKVSKLKSVLLHCHSDSIGNASGGDQIALRRMTINGESYLLLANPDTLGTRVERESCHKCEPMSALSLESSHLGAILSRTTKDFKTGHSRAIVNAGLKHSLNEDSGSYLTADLCPSHKGMDRDLIEVAKRLSPRPLKLALSISGGWLRHHANDFQWLKSQVQEGALDITWVNHSNKHPFKVGLPNEENFLLTPGVDVEAEIIETERLMIANGITPSLFFRFPGLVSEASQLEILKKHLLIPLGADAWLALGERPKAGSILLIHANGNEPLGKRIFEKLARENKIPLPFRPLPDSVRGR